MPDGIRLKVLDFGIAKLGESAPGAATKTGMAMGTCPYMAPGQWRGAKLADARTDEYALGYVLYELLLGAPPFPGPGVAEYMDQHRFREPVLPGARRADLAAFDHIIRTALAKSMDDRFPSLVDLIAALPACDRLDRAPRPRARARRVWAIDMVLVAATVLCARSPVSPRAEAALPAETATARAELDALLRRQGAPASPADCPHTAVVAEPLALLARAQLATSGAEVARPNATKAVELCPELALGYDVLGNVEQASGRLEAADAAYRRALELAPTYAAPRFNLAVLALRRGDAPLAVELLDQLVARDPSDAHAHLLRGQAQILLGHLTQAIADLEAATIGEPSEGAAWLLLGQARLKAGQERPARDAFCRARRLGMAEAEKLCAP